MTDASLEAAPADSDPKAQVASLELSFGKVGVKARLQVTPAGLLAIGGLVSVILMSTAALVWVAAAPARRHPIAARLPLR